MQQKYLTLLPPSWGNTWDNNNITNDYDGERGSQ